jgi:hypothetical protein
MHRGYLFVVAAIDSGHTGGSFEVYDISDPRNPVEKYRKCDSSTNPLREMHSYGLWRNDTDGKEYIALPSTKGIQIWNITNPLAPSLTNDMSLTSITADDYGDGAWSVQWVGKYIYVGGSGNGLYTIDATDPANPKLYDPYHSCWNGVNGCVGAPLEGGRRRRPAGQLGRGGRQHHADRWRGQQPRPVVLGSQRSAQAVHQGHDRPRHGQHDLHLPAGGPA